MSLIQTDFKPHFMNINRATKNKDIKWKNPFNESFLDHCLPILGSIKLEYRAGKVSSSDTLAGLIQTERFETPNGITTGDNVKYLVNLLYLAKRGDLLPGSQIRHSRLATFTPLTLYAHKLYHGVPYEKWNKEDPKIAAFLGNTLELILTDKIIPKLTLDEKLEYRKQALTFKSGMKEGKQEHPYNYKCAISTLKDVPLSRPSIMMTLQLWLANAAVRNIDSMILDPLNWDNVPEPMDQIGLPEIQTTKGRIHKAITESADDVPWM